LPEAATGETGAFVRTSTASSGVAAVAIDELTEAGALFMSLFLNQFSV
jgi:hypothetical protein